MAKAVALTKILNVRESEKKDAQIAYHESMARFETVATKLYDVLRRKELAEDTYEGYLQATTAIDIIKEQATYIEVLNKHILTLQHDVQQARSLMEGKQGKLADAHVEVKKFEKIIDIRKEAEKAVILKMEKASMDEISIQQYLSKK